MHKAVPKDQQEEITCSTCQHVSRVAILPESWPHLYCTKCHNVYHEVDNQYAYKRIKTNWGRRKRMNIVESQAPLCECGGMFLFNAKPNCPNFKQDLHMFDELKTKNGVHPEEEVRVFHDDMVIFPDTTEYMENGHTNTYDFQ